MPTDFLCFAKESQQRKATPGRPPVRRLRRRWSLALLENRGRPVNGASAAPPLSRVGLPPGFLRCSAGFMGPQPRLSAARCVLMTRQT